MNKKIAFLVMAVFALLSISLLVGMKSSEEPLSETTDTSFAVVELFTSQGCSSCPPADRLLTQILKEAESTGKQIIPLSFHVDYWNYLGWKDPYSSSAYSVRQRTYAQKLQSGVYTPQMVFNGSEECVGSNKYKVESLITKVRQKQLTHDIEFEMVYMKEVNAWRVDYEVKGHEKTDKLNVALVERNIETQVKRGENHGRKLHHENVVRKFHVLDLKDAKGSVVLDLPKDFKKKDGYVYLYSQDGRSWAVEGAARKKLI
ncbi:MAG: DUF1223 domain-containing protein [Bacteroidota bacterium]